jgi:hypothetical protein
VLSALIPMTMPMPTMLLMSVPIGVDLDIDNDDDDDVLTQRLPGGVWLQYVLRNVFECCIYAA